MELDRRLALLLAFAYELPILSAMMSLLTASFNEQFSYPRGLSNLPLTF